METYPPPSYAYPDSGGSSPRSRDVDFDNAPPSAWEDTASAPAYKVKFMVSYGGKIQPRPHDNLLSYVGGETKILSVDSFVKFSTMYAKLGTLFSPVVGESMTGFTVKYQLPGEDLDALISVTNDEDLEHMMHEYDRMLRGSIKSVRLRLFLFNESNQWRSNSGAGSAFSSVESETGKIGADVEHAGNKYVDPVIVDRHLQQQQQLQQQQRQQNDVVLDAPLPPPQRAVSPPVHGNVDFLFGLEKGPVHVPGPIPVHSEPVSEIGRFSNPVQDRLQFQQQQQQQQQQHQQQSAMYYQKNENFGDPYLKTSSPANIPAQIQATGQIPAGYWQQAEQQPPQMQHLHHQQQYHPPPPPQQQPQQQQQQPMYMMHAPPPQQGSVYHAPPPMRGQIQPNQGYYQPLYSTPAAAPAAMPTMGSAAAQVRPVMAGEAAGYQQAAAGRPVYYTAAPPQSGGLVAPPFPGMKATVVPVSGVEMRGSGDGKGVLKGVPSSTTV